MTYLLQVSTCWIVLYGIYKLLLQKETFFSINRYYLLSALLAGLIIPSLGGFLPANQTSTEIYQVMNQVSTVEITPYVEQSKSIFTWIKVLYMVYFAGAIMVFSRFVYGLYRIYNIYSIATKIKYKNYILVKSTKFHLPFSFFHFIFISKELPLHKDVEKVLKHEELHANQWHSLDIMITELLQVFFWFNPILMFYKRALRQSHEFLADEYVTKDHNRSSYGQLLLRQSTSGLEIALANQFFHSQIKKRITMMYKEKSKRPAMVKYLMAVPVLIGLLVLFASSKSNDQPQESTDSECLPIKIEDHNTYSSEGQPITLSEIETKFNGSSPPDCIDLNFNHSTLINSATPIIDIAATMNIDIHLSSGELDLERLKATFGENSLNITDAANFGGRKIVQRNWHQLSSGKNRKIEGIITVLAEANSNGDIIYAEIVKEKSTIENKSILHDALITAKKYKIEKGEGSVKGELSWNFSLPKLSPEYIYNSNKEEFEFRERDAIPPPPPAEGELFKVVEEMPRFPGCEDLDGSAKEKEKCAKQKMLEFIYKNLKYPKEARNADIEGMTVIQFIIEKDGRISSGKIARDIGAGCGTESLRIVNSMPTWIPGKQKGKAVRVQYTLPVKFKIGGNELSSEQKNFMVNITAFGEKSEKAIKENLVVNGKQTHPIKNESDDLYKIVEEMPRFSGCEHIENTSLNKDECAKNKLLEFIYTNVKYPKEARIKGIEGVAVVQLIIEKDGSVSSTKLLRDPGAGTGKEAKRVIDIMPKWVPGKQNGKPVRVQYVLPIKYKLEGDSKDDKKDKVDTNDLLSKEVDQKPLFPNTASEKESVEKLLNFVSENVAYPKKAAQNNIEGMAVVKFVINTKGNIQKVKLLKSPGWGIDESVIQLLDKMQQIEAPWTPAKLDDKNVNYEYVLPVKFKLENQQKEEIKSKQLNIQVLNIKPNPSNGIFNLAFNIEDKTPADVIFYSMNGQHLKSLKNVNIPYTKSIDLSEYNGQTIYMQIVQNEKIHTEKIIIH